MQSMKPIEFDKWVEAQIEAMDKYIKELQPVSPDKDKAEPKSEPTVRHYHWTRNGMEEDVKGTWIKRSDMNDYIAFEAACNPDLMEAETNYKLYQEQLSDQSKLISKYEQLVTAYKKKIAVWMYPKQLWNKIRRLESELNDLKTKA
jgi:hypothetical protein